MYRTTVVLPNALKLAVEEAAKVEGVSFAEVVRRALERELAVTGKEPNRRVRDPIFTAKFEAFLAEGSSGPSDGADNHDRYLYGE